jgi:hypothetical protein
VAPASAERPAAPAPERPAPEAIPERAALDGPSFNAFAVRTSGQRTASEAETTDEFTAGPDAGVRANA